MLVQPLAWAVKVNDADRATMIKNSEIRILNVSSKFWIFRSGCGVNLVQVVARFNGSQLLFLSPCKLLKYKGLVFLAPPVMNQEFWFGAIVARTRKRPPQ